MARLGFVGLGVMGSRVVKRLLDVCAQIFRAIRRRGPARFGRIHAVLRERGEDDAFQAVAAMRQGMTVDLDSGLAMEAAALGLKENLPFADAVIYATARKHEATVWTQDEHFSGKTNVRFKARSRPR